MKQDYNEFIEKFKPKKTTDDCYTPPKVYDAVCDWVCSEYGVDKNNFIRPFYPGGDFENYEYKASEIVVDNPPFSIFSKIVRFYSNKGIKFFLFAPSLTLFSPRVHQFVAYLCANVSITYENGANVKTSFVTNLEAPKIRSCPTLYENLKNTQKRQRHLSKYSYPQNLIQQHRISYLSEHSVDIKIPAQECFFVSRLDEQKASKKKIFGGGFLISDRAVTELKDAELKAKKQHSAKIVSRENIALEKLQEGTCSPFCWELSEREKNIIKSLE